MQSTVLIGKFIHIELNTRAVKQVRRKEDLRSHRSLARRARRLPDLAVSVPPLPVSSYCSFFKTAATL